MELFEAIYKRQAVRKYSLQPLKNDALKKVEDAISSAKRLYPEISMNTYIEVDGSKAQTTFMSGMVGSYGKILAPHYIIVTSEEKEGYLENIGYVLEQVVLKLVTMGIGSCWIGGLFNAEAVKQYMKLPENHKPVIVLSFGYPADKNSFSKERKSKRKSIESFTTGSLDDITSKMLDAVRVAPSAMNSQPWRFIVEGNVIHTYMNNSGLLIKKMLENMNMIDMGIAICHLETAATALGKMVKLKEMAHGDNWGSKYVISASID